MVRFKCGCIGFPMNDTTYMCLRPCDSDGSMPGVFFSLRAITPGSQDSYTRLEDTAVAELQCEVNGVLNDGYRYRDLQQSVKAFMGDLK